MKLANGLKIAAEVLLDLVFAFLLLGGIGEMIHGNYFNGIVGYLIPAFFSVLFMLIAWKRPLYAGILLSLLSLVFWAPLVATVLVNRNPNRYIEDAVTSGIPLLLIGLLLLLAAWKTPKTAV